MHITVFGAAGWAGRAVLQNLAGRHEVRAVDLNAQAWDKLADLDGPPPDGEVVQCDIRDYHAVDRCLEGTDAVIHLTVAFPGEKEKAEKGFSVNLHGLWNLLECCRVREIGPIVHVGSCQVEHPTEFLESHVRRHDGHAYAVTKRLQEEMCRQFHEAWGSRIIVLRPAQIVDLEKGLAHTRDRLGTGHWHTSSGWICRHDLAEACRCAAESTTIDHDILHIVGTPESDATCNASRAREVLGFEPKGDVERYRRRGGDGE